jgi:hypothetical protein
MSRQSFWRRFAIGAFFVVTVGSLLTPFGQVLEAHAGAITGIATAVLAVVTWRLVTLGQDQAATTRAQLRAYLSVVIGTAVYQDDRLNFEAKPTIINNGNTPAKNVRYRIKADVFTDSVAAGYTFLEPPEVPKSQSSIGPRENRMMSAVLNHRVSDGEVEDIKHGKGKALWVWGVVHYDDVFDKPHVTQFCQRLTWLMDDSTIYGFYDGRFGLSD